jgi:hypothetical protein
VVVLSGGNRAGTAAVSMLASLLWRRHRSSNTRIAASSSTASRSRRRMHDATPAPYGNLTRRWTLLAEADRNAHASRLVGTDHLAAGIDQPDEHTAGNYRRLLVAAVDGDEVALGWLATSHRPLLLARGRSLYAEDPSEWGAVALELLHTTLKRANLDEGRWLRRSVAVKLAAGMARQVADHATRRQVEQLTDPTRLHPLAHTYDVEPDLDLSAAISTAMARLDAPTRDGLRALADQQPLQTVAERHELSHAALRQRISRARHRLQPQLAPFLRTVA